MTFDATACANLLSLETCALVARYTETLHDTGAMRPDKLVPGAPARYGDPLMDSVLELLRERVERVVGEDLLPTYSYVRVYGHGDVLPTHIDRPECEVSVTLCVQSTGPAWPLHVQAEGGTVQALTTDVGDGIVYAGPQHAHWREPFQGTRQIQLFVHYVRKNGPHAHLATDGRGKLGVSKRPETVAAGLSDYIMVVDDAVSDATIRHVLGVYKDCDLWGLGTVGAEDRVDPAVRDCQVLELSRPEVIQGRPERQQVDDQLFQVVGALGRAYSARFPRVGLKSDTGYLLMRYPHGAFYAEHVDHFREVPRALSMSLFLNDDFEGGGLSFFGGAFTIHPKRARAVVFPSNFLYPHQVIRVTNGTRYAVVTWFS